MRFDFGSVEDVDSYVFVPEGEHNCRVAEVREGSARDGSVRWSFRLEVLDGEWAGRTAAWDSLTWSERGVYRVKKVLQALGLDVRGELEIEPQDLVNLQARVKIVPEEREDPVTGRRQIRNRVPYLGYARLAEGEPEGSPGDESGGRGDGRGDETEGSPQPDADPLAPVDAWRAGSEPAAHGSRGSDDETAF